MDKEKSKNSIIDTNLLNKAITAGLSEVFRVKTVSSKKDKVRKTYGSEVIESVIFDFPNSRKDAFMKELEQIDKENPVKTIDYGDLLQ